MFSSWNKTVDDDDDPTDACLFCKELFLQFTGGEGWEQYIVSKVFANEECNRYDPSDVFVFDFLDIDIEYIKNCLKT